MKVPVDEILVTDIAGHVAVVVTDVTAAADVLTQLGFARQSDRWERAIADDTDHGHSLLRLSISMRFLCGPRLGPQALVEYYREIGVVRCGYRSVAWRGPTQYVIEQHD